MPFKQAALKPQKAFVYLNKSTVMKKILFPAVLFMALFSCKEPESPKVAGVQGIDMDAAGKAIAAANSRLGQALGSGDSAAVVAYITPKQSCCHPTQPEWTGAGGMGSFALAGQKMGITKASLQTAELLDGGEYVIEKGAYELTAGNNAFDKGKYIVIWKQEAGEWKLFRDIWNSDNPPPPAAK
jgi:ketosteroid isomerase-like protein